LGTLCKRAPAMTEKTKKVIMYSFTTISLLISSLGAILFGGCKQEETNDCRSKGAILETFITPEGKEAYIFENGAAFINNNGSCEFVLQYFDPNFLSNNYKVDATGKFLITNEGLFPVKNEFIDNVQSYSVFTDLFIKSIADTHLYWSGFTLQSPAAKTVSDYVALRKCILDGTCTFFDNKIELASDPLIVTNQVLKFTSVAPTPRMVTAKTSIESEINFFEKDADLWFQADYFLESGTPFSIADFENSYFDEGPGPRVVIRNNVLSVENKFGAKKEYFQSSPVSIPSKKWFTVKVHLKFNNLTAGVIELWQDGIKVISATGINLPTSNSIQNRVEVGVTATSVGCVLFMDNIKISSSPF
jgi:Polysaccharide lyase